MGNMSGSYGSHYTLRLNAYVLEQTPSVNRSTIRADLWLDFDGSSYSAYTNYATSGTITINGDVGNASVGSINFSSNVASSVYLGTHDVWVYHNNDGTCPAISVTGSWDTATSRIGSGSTSTTVTPPSIPRYATIKTFSVNKRDATSVTFVFTTDVNVDYAWYSKNNGSTWSDLPVNQIVTGLSANTTYNFKLRVRRADSGLTTDSGTVSQTTYPYTIPTISLSNKTVNSITVSSGCNVSVSSTQYRIKQGSGNYGSYQNSATFNNLTPNTSYTIEVKKIARDSGLSGTATLNVTTYQIGKFTSIADANFGDNLIIIKTNPSGQHNNIKIQTINPVDDIVEITDTSDNMTISLTDEQWDKLYKKLGNNNFITIRYIVETISNNISYEDYIDKNLPLTGNQKTGHININGNWKRTKRYIKVNGIWKRAVRWININGTWKRCI